MLIKKIINMYQQINSNISMILMDREFDWRRKKITGLELNTTESREKYLIYTDKQE